MTESNETSSDKRRRENKHVEDFDFHRLTEDLTNSITDSLYREYSDDAMQRYRKHKEDGLDDKASNELKVQEIVDGIKKNVSAGLVEDISRSIRDQVYKELEEQYYPQKGSIEERVDNAVKITRWIALVGFLPIYGVVLILGLVIFLESIDLIFQGARYGVQVVSHIAEHWNDVGPSAPVPRMALNQVVATILSILDLVLLCSLVMMVLVGGYENTIARIGKSHNVPTWFGKLDIGQLKIKVAASIVIISSIHLLMSFMRLDINEPIANPLSLMWTAIVHGVFVFSALALAYMERINRHTEDRRPVRPAVYPSTSGALEQRSLER